MAKIKRPRLSDFMDLSTGEFDTQAYDEAMDLYEQLLLEGAEEDNNQDPDYL